MVDRTWVPQNSPTNSVLNGPDAVGYRSWAVGAGGTIITRSRDDAVLADFVPPETSVTSDLTRWVTTPGGAELGFSVSDTASPSLKGHVVRAQAKAVRAAGVAPVTQTSLDSGKSWQSSERHLVTAQGETAFLSRSIDQAGNIETARTSSVRVDNQAPESDDDAPTGTVDGPVAVRLDAIDAVSGVATIEYRRQGPSVGP